MARKWMMIAALAASVAGTLVPASVMAQDHGWARNGHYDRQRGDYRHGDNRQWQDYRGQRADYGRGYDRGGWDHGGWDHGHDGGRYRAYDRSGYDNGHDDHGRSRDWQR